MEINNNFVNKNAILDIRPINEQKEKPLKVKGIEVVSLPFYQLDTKFQELDQSKIWMLWCDRGVMSRLQMLLLQERGFKNVKIYYP